MMQIHDMEQGTESWFRVRMGLPTASEFSNVLAKGEGKTRRAYMLRLAGEILTGEPAETFSSVHMERGKAMEAEARDLYTFVEDEPLTRVGFIVNGPKGCSPDALVGEHGMAEFKTALPAILIDRLLKGGLPPEHKAQVQGNLWVAERDWIDLCIFWPRLPLFKVRVHRDETYIAELSRAVDAFNAELAETVEMIRSYGRPLKETLKLSQGVAA